MRRTISGWVVPLLLVGTLAYALAEDLTLTTYYPSPRGVYKELRTSEDVAIGTTTIPSDPFLQPRLYVVGTNFNPTLRVDDTPTDGGDLTPFVINSTGNVGIGTTDAGGFKLKVQGALKLTGNLVDANSQIIYDQSTQKIPGDRLPFKKGDLIAPADRPIIAGLSTYTTHYFSLANLGISGTAASNVKSGVTFGPGDAIAGTLAAGIVARGFRFGGQVPTTNEWEDTVTGGLSIAANSGGWACAYQGTYGSCNGCSPLSGVRLVCGGQEVYALSMEPTPGSGGIIHGFSPVIPGTGSARDCMHQVKAGTTRNRGPSWGPLVDVSGTCYFVGP